MADQSRTCADCPTVLARGNKSGRCRPCAARVAYADPAKRERRLAALRVALRSPETRARKCRAAQKRERDRRDDPTWHAYKVASGQRLRRDYLGSAEGQAKNAAKRKRVGAQRTTRFLGWCPPDRRSEYRRLQKAFGAADARRMIEADMTPHERQLARVAAGAALVAKPDLRTAGPAFTLGGIATGQL